MWLALTDLDCGVSVAGQCINDVKYANDIMLITQSMDEMSLMLQCIKSTSEHYGFPLNIQTKVMVIGNVDCEAKQLTIDDNVEAEC